ncbi:MAG: hypothetical protein AB1750_16925, partial [Chloroflexota bacterium]
MRTKPILVAVVSLALFAALAFQPASVLAASDFTVTPSLVYNNVATIITLEAIDPTSFDANSVVILENFGVLNTTYYNSKVLTAIVPAGVEANNPDNPKYDISVTTSGAPWICSNCLTVSLPSLERPRVVMEAYSSDLDPLVPNREFTLTVTFRNTGTKPAYSPQVVFTSADLSPAQTIPVSLDNPLGEDTPDTLSSDFVLRSASGKSRAVVDATVTYYDQYGTLYTDKYTISLRIRATGGGGGGGNNNGGGGGVPIPTSTPTAGPVNGPQLVISSYDTSVDPLQPGLQFKLSLTIKNVGNAKADRITMIVGGGTTSGGNGTPSGGVSGGSGSFGDFAPIGSSNVQSLGALKAGATLQASQNLIVNVSTNPGAYPLTITFSYQNDKGEFINDNQVITLLVYSLPNLDISFYQPPAPFFAGQPGALPIQIVNLGKRTVVLGNVAIESEDGIVESGTALVGTLDPGGYFTLDSFLTPDRAGPIELLITIEYTDDFNQPRTVTKTLVVEAEELTDDFGGDPGLLPAAPVEETFLQKLWRFILGLLGLDSSRPIDDSMMTPEPIPAPAKPGGKG